LSPQHHFGRRMAASCGGNMVDLEAGKPFIGYRLEGLFRFGFRLANLGLSNFNRVLTICQRFRAAVLLSRAFARDTFG